MGIVDFILNLAGLLLWLNWRSLKFDPLQKRTPVTLVGTLRPAVQKKFRRWHLLAAIGALIILRALLYWQIGSAIHWTGNLDLGVIALSFRSDWFWRILLFSFLSFGLMLWTFYLWLLLLSILAKPQPVHRFVQIQLGEVDHWSRRTKIFLPFVCSAIAWWVASWLFDWLQIIPASVSPWRRIEQSLLIGLASYLVWETPAVLLLALQLLNNYIYFGKNPIWDYINTLAQKLLQPLKGIPLRTGKIDFAPVVGIALIFLLAKLAERGLDFLYARVPL